RKPFSWIRPKSRPCRARSSLSLSCHLPKFDNPITGRCQGATVAEKNNRLDPVILSVPCGLRLTRFQIPKRQAAPVIARDQGCAVGRDVHRGNHVRQPAQAHSYPARRWVPDPYGWVAEGGSGESPTVG